MTLIALKLAWRETRRQVRSLSFSLFVTLTCLLSSGSAYVGVKELRIRQQEAAVLEQERLLDVSRARFGLQGRQPETALRVIRRPEPSSILVHGAEHEVPTYWDFGPAGTVTGTVPVSTQKSPVSIDLEFAVRGLLGLLMVLLAVESLAGDRESGVQAAILAQPLPYSVLFIGKVIGGAASALLALLLVIVTSWLGIVAADPGASSHAILVVLLLLAVSGEIYLLVMFTVGLLAASIATSRAAAAVAGLIAWIILAWATPAVSSFIADAVIAARPVQLVEHQRQVAYDSALRHIQETMGTHFLALAGPRSNWDQALLLPPVKAQLETDWAAGAQKLRIELDASEQEGARLLVRRQRFVQEFDFLNPASQFAVAAETLTGTSNSVTMAWLTTVADYQHLMNRTLFDNPPRLTLSVPEGTGRSLVNYIRAKPIDLASVPAFQPPATALTERVRQSLAPILVLLVWCVALGTSACIVGAKKAAVQW